jgi:hypothetical protein
MPKMEPKHKKSIFKSRFDRFEKKQKAKTKKIRDPLISKTKR